MSSSARRLALVTTLLAGAFAAGAAGALPNPAHAQQQGSVSCNATGQTNFTPGVQTWPQSHQVNYVGDDRACQDSTGQFTSARITANFRSVQLSCLASGFGTGSGSGTIRWNTGATSEVDLNIDSTVLNTASVSGTVRSGPHAGKRFTGKIVTDLLGGAGKCTAGALFGGVKSADFTGDYSIG